MTTATEKQALNFIRKSEGVVDVLNDRSTLSFGTIQIHKLGTRTITCFLTNVSGLNRREMDEICVVMEGIENDVELEDILA